jgi:hypothetical protein
MPMSLHSLYQSQSQSYVTTDGQSASVLVSSPHLGPKIGFRYCQTVAGLLMWGTLSDEMTGLSFTITVCPCQLCHSRVLVPRGSEHYFTVSDSRLPQPGGPRSSYLYRLGTGWSSYTPRHWVTFRLLRQLAGLRWRYRNRLHQSQCQSYFTTGSLMQISSS